MPNRTSCASLGQPVGRPSSLLHFRSASCAIAYRSVSAANYADLFIQSFFVGSRQSRVTEQQSHRIRAGEDHALFQIGVGGGGFDRCGGAIFAPAPSSARPPPPRPRARASRAYVARAPPEP